MSKKKPEPASSKAADLLPPDGPAPVDPSMVMASDASLEPEVETRKIGIRRVSCLEFGNRFYSRANRRPAGNSRRFWSKIEADDPFKKAPARPTDAPLEVYPAQRIERADGSLPKPQPEVARAYPPPTRLRAEGDVEDAPRAKPSSPPPKPAAPPPQQAAPPQKQAAPPPKPQPPKPQPPKAPRNELPEPTYTPEPRPAPRPAPPRPFDDTEEEPERPTPPRAVDPLDASRPSRLPPKPSNPKATSGRMQANPGRQRMPSKAPVDDRPTAAEIRDEKKKMRDIGTGEAPPTKSISLDAYRNFVQLMEVQQAAHERGEEVPRAFADVDDGPRPKPKTIVQRPKADDPPADRSPPVPAKPTPPKSTPPKPTPPRPAAPKAEAPAPKPAAPAAKAPPVAPVDRTPPKPGAPAAPAGAAAKPPSAGDLDDLFGGANEGRVRIGKRAAKKEPGPEET